MTELTQNKPKRDKVVKYLKKMMLSQINEMLEEYNHELKDLIDGKNAQNVLDNSLFDGEIKKFKSIDDYQQLVFTLFTLNVLKEYVQSSRSFNETEYVDKKYIVYSIGTEDLMVLIYHGYPVDMYLNHILLNHGYLNIGSFLDDRFFGRNINPFLVIEYDKAKKENNPRFATIVEEIYRGENNE